MSDYYEELLNIVVYKKDGTETKFTDAEWGKSGNFIVIYQKKTKTILPMEEVDKLELEDNE